jgi:hypothetical protein
MKGPLQMSSQLTKHGFFFKSQNKNIKTRFGLQSLIDHHCKNDHHY